MSGVCVIWDFNGTILDDVQTGIDSINILLSRRGLHTLSGVAEYHSHFHFPIIDYYRELGFDFEKEAYSDVAIEWVAEYDRLVPSAGLCPGVREAIDSFSRAGIIQIVLSATEQTMLQRQISGLGLEGLFDRVLGMDNIEAHTKLPAARRFMEEQKPSRAIMIGDTSHDFEVAREIGSECVLVAAGHQPRRDLERLGVPVFDSLSDAAKSIISSCEKN